MKYQREDFLSDGVSSLNKVIKPIDLDGKDKIAFVKLYEKM